MDRKKICMTSLGMFFLLLAVIVCTCVLKSTQAERRERERVHKFSDPTNPMTWFTMKKKIGTNGYTGDVEKMVKERIAEAYALYQQYGLIYDMESNRLYYNGLPLFLISYLFNVWTVTKEVLCYWYVEYTFKEIRYSL